jgi:hypothetical protein
LEVHPLAVLKALLHFTLKKKSINNNNMQSMAFISSKGRDRICHITVQIAAVTIMRGYRNTEPSDVRPMTLRGEEGEGEGHLQTKHGMKRYYFLQQVALTQLF